MKYAEYAGVVLERSQQTVPNAVRIHLGGILQQTAPLFFHQIKLEDHLLHQMVRSSLMSFRLVIVRQT